MKRVKKSEASGIRLVAYIATAHDPSSNIFGWGAVIDPGKNMADTRYEGGECASASTFETAIVGALELIARIKKRYGDILSLTLHGPQNLIEGIDRITKTGSPGGQERFKTRWLQLFADSREISTVFKATNKPGNRGKHVSAMIRIASDMARQHSGLLPRPSEQEIVLPCPNCELAISAVLKENGTVLVDYTSCECS